MAVLDIPSLSYQQNEMRFKHVRMLIRPDGTCTVDAINFADASCQQATQQITDALAGRTLTEHNKPEGRNRPQTVGRRLEATR